MEARVGERWLVIDTCAVEASGVALVEEARVVALAELPESTASAGLLGAVRALLEEERWELASLHAVGVVNGPGSFTGVRVGLAAAKGLCEALGVPMAGVSRLEMLARTSGLSEGASLLDAGRGEVFAREIASGREFLVKVDAVAGIAAGKPVVVAEERLAEKLSGLDVRCVKLSVADAVGLVGDMLRAGGSDVAGTDANYVRGEAQIYGAAKA
jgi:tRNA threonylcarbamoyladenosine biosynthesis protein TsaB